MEQFLDILSYVVAGMCIVRLWYIILSYLGWCNLLFDDSTAMDKIQTATFKALYVPVAVLCICFMWWLFGGPVT